MFPGFLLLLMAGVIWKWEGVGGGKEGGREGGVGDVGGGGEEEEMGVELLGRKEGGREGGREGEALKNVPKLKEGGKEGGKADDAWAAWREAGREGGTWILALQYAVSFGVEMVCALPLSLPSSLPPSLRGSLNIGGLSQKLIAFLPSLSPSLPSSLL